MFFSRPDTAKNIFNSQDDGNLYLGDKNVFCNGVRKSLNNPKSLKMFFFFGE